MSKFQVGDYFTDPKQKAYTYVYQVIEDDPGNIYFITVKRVLNTAFPSLENTFTTVSRLGLKNMVLCNAAGLPLILTNPTVQPSTLTSHHLTQILPVQYASLVAAVKHKYDIGQQLVPIVWGTDLPDDKVFEVVRRNLDTDSYVLCEITPNGSSPAFTEAREFVETAYIALANSSAPRVDCKSGRHDWADYNSGWRKYQYCKQCNASTED